MLQLNITAHLQPELVANIDKLLDEGHRFWQDMSPEIFVKKVDRTWSPAENVVHLLKSTRPVAKALGYPRWLLRLLFGKANAPSRHWIPLREVYLQKLAEGTEPGSYGPKPMHFDAPIESKRQLIDKLQQALALLRTNLERWKETDLDRYPLPHPSLGKLTIREMVIFTLFHYQHHFEKVLSKI
jgi:hypothetical protein